MLMTSPAYAGLMKVDPQQTSSRTPLSRLDAWLSLPVTFAAAFLFSMWILPYYQYGDQRHYRAFYEVCASIPFFDVFSYQRRMLGAAEPIYAITAWISSRAGMDKDVFISLINSGLVSTLFIALRKYRVNYLIIILCFSNFYLLVLLTSAERLKFGYLLLLASLAANEKYRIPLMLGSILGHFQMAITVLSLAASRAPFFMAQRQHGAGQSGKFFGIAALGLVFLFFVFEYFGMAIYEKIAGYAERNFSLEGAVLIIPLIIFGLFFCKNKLKMLLAMLPPLSAILVLGPSRTNMIGFISWMAMMIEDKRENAIIVYPILLYFSFRSIEYIDAILKYGDGFVRV